MKDTIEVIGAKSNNLKNINVSLPRNKMIVFTGVSGSGKSTLAFDTIFAEGQRRYVESLSSYARQFLGQMEKPDVEYIDGLSPAISIDQKTTSHNPRSTVGTITEIYDYLRLLYARVGTVYCVNCGKEISMQTVDQICDKIKNLYMGEKILVLAPVVRGRKGEYKKQLDGYFKSGYARVKVDDIVYLLEDEIPLDKNKKHNISVVVDRIKVSEDITTRLYDAVESAIKLANGLISIEVNGEEVLFSNKYSCPDCDISLEELEPRLFSFNSPFGACKECSGLGFKNEVNINALVKDDSLSINEGAISIAGWNIDNGKMIKMWMEAVSKQYGFSLDTPFKDLSKEAKDLIFYGTNSPIQVNYVARNGYTGTFNSNFEGIANNIERRYKETTSEYAKQELEKYMIAKACSSCHGKRLKKEALAVKIAGLNIMDFCDLSVEKELEFINNLVLDETKTMIARQILKEIKARLQFLMNVGLSYLTLSRSAGTLSGGEAQRIRLATQIGSGLTGVLYILDEPSIGLHQRDNDKLIKALLNLRDLGNTLIVVEHDEDTIRSADYIVDIGVGAGEKGGNVVVQGTLEEVMNCKESITGDYLSGRKKIEIPSSRRKIENGYLKLYGAKQNNLKNVDVKIPLSVFTCVTGVSGSGKSSLVNEILYPYLAKKLNNVKIATEGQVDKIEGVEKLDKVINIDQSPIGRTPRSNPATYTGVFTKIRELFASTPDAKERGYAAGRFSFNVKGGRCENCTGDGIIKIEMHFLPDIYVPCEVCKGKRYNRETLEVKYKGKSIYDILDMTVDEATTFFENIPSIYSKIKCLKDVGLGYIRLGQSATTLSGGEAQRVKLATELSKRQTGKTIYILDEPTTGLHTSDVKKLIKILQKLVDNGNTVVVIEHNLDVIKVCDHIIDLGKEGGDKGGEIIATGTPEEIANNKESYTGEFLKKVLLNK